MARATGGSDASDTHPLDSLLVEGDLEALEEEAGPDTSPDEGFLIVYTSGTTSRPKGCFHTFNTYRASSLAIIKSLNYTDADVQFGPSPITHTTGLVTSVVVPLIAGAQSYVMEAFDPEEALRRIEQHGLHRVGHRDALPADAHGCVRPGQARRQQHARCGSAPDPRSPVPSSSAPGSCSGARR